MPVAHVARMTRHLATVFALGLLVIGAVRGSAPCRDLQLHDTPPLAPTLAGASPMGVFVCPFEQREGTTVFSRSAVVLNPQCVLRGDEALRDSAHTTLDPDQIGTVPLNGKPAMVLVRDGRATLMTRSSPVGATILAADLNIGGTTKVDGVDRYVALHFSGDRTTDAAGGECDSYLHPGRRLPP